MVYCCIIGCQNTHCSGSKKRFFRIPSVIKNQCQRTRTLSEARRRLWISRINRNQLNTEIARVCDVHFLAGRPSTLFEDTNVDWAPSVHLGYDCSIMPQLQQERHERRINRQEKRKKVLNDITNTASSSCKSSEDQAESISMETHYTDIQSNDLQPNHSSDKENEMNVSKLSVPSVCVEGDATFTDLNCSVQFNISMSSQDTVMSEMIDRSSCTSVDDNVSCNSSDSIFVPIISVEPYCMNNVTDSEDMYYECSDLPFSKTKTVKLCDSSTQTEMEGAHIFQLETDNKYLREEVIELKKKIVKYSDVSEEKLRQTGNEKMVKFYTGIPSFSLLWRIFSFIQIALPPQSEKNSLTKFQEFLLVMMRLRLNVPLLDLAYRFGISHTTACRIFTKWIDVMDVRLKPIIRWPEREDLWNAMPNSFKRVFGNKVAVIIDCFEVFIIRPSAFLARAVTFSNYKHHNTVKYLIGITPAGTISFLSEGYGGRCSDKFITEDCGFLDHVLPGDTVMADRGFNISETLGYTNSSLLVPTFTKGKSQLEMVETEETRKISNLRIHVERVIGLVRGKYRILSGTLPVECLASGEGESPLIDKIATVCCALTNFCPSIVPQD